MDKGRITVVGIGPGSREDMTPAAARAISEADVIVGYKYYFRFVESIRRKDSLCVDTGMKREADRAAEALRHARLGRKVVVISSGDAGIYGMAPLIFEMASKEKAGEDIEISTVPGISASRRPPHFLEPPRAMTFA